MTAPSLFDGPVQIGPLNAQLRPYQQAAIDGLYEWFRAGKGNPLVVVPTGGGKSVIQAAFIHSVLAQWPSERIVCLTHVKELIAQNHAALLRAVPNAPAGICSAGLRRRDLDAPILFAGIQTVFRQSAKVGSADLVLVDEAHLIPQKGFGMYRQFLDDQLSMNPNLRVIGFTATPFRTDSGSLDAGDDRLFHGTAYECDIVELIKDGYLSPVISKGTKSAIDTTGVRKQAGDFKSSELEAAARADGKVAAAVEEIVARGADRRGWLIFCCGIDHAHDVAAELTRHGIDNEVVTGKTKSDERDRVVERFKAKQLRAIVNVGVFTTGFDAPHVDLIALMRPTCSPGLFVQMVGRGLRRAEGKEDALVLDFGGNVVRHGPIDCIKVKQPKSGDDAVMARECPNCSTLVAIQTRVCPECGFEWAVIEGEVAGPRHEAKPDEQSMLVAGLHPTGGIERWRVKRVRYSCHHKKGRPFPVMRVDYDCGFNQRVSEWICLEHHGFPRKKAEAWWRARAGAEDDVPETVDLALLAIEAGRFDREPAGVTVDIRSEYPELKAVRFDREPGEDDFEPPPQPSEQLTADEIPF